MSYRSLAGPSLCDPVRFAQTVAQMRPCNDGLSVTGAISCDRGQIQHWIEGPEAAVAGLWDRIRLDPRHRVHWASPPAVVTERHFPGSAMKLAMTTADLARLDPWLVEDAVALPETAVPSGLAIWPDAPQGADQHAHSCRLMPTRAAALAAILTGADALAARRQLDGVLRMSGLAEAAALVQAVLQDLDDGWMAGSTTDLQRQLALALLQSALRLWLDVEELQQTVGCALVSALPGTPDLCCVMLKVALLRRAGWSVRLLLPQTADRIRAVAQDLQPDLIVLAGSRMAVRPTEMALLSGLLPALASDCTAPVILGGKLAETDPQALLRLGAAAVCTATAWIATIAFTLAPPKHVAQSEAGHEADVGRAGARARTLAASRSRRV